MNKDGMVQRIKEGNKSAASQSKPKDNRQVAQGNHSSFDRIAKRAEVAGSRTSK